MTQSLLALLLACDNGAGNFDWTPGDDMDFVCGEWVYPTWTLGLTGSLDEPFLVIGGHSVEEDGTGHEFRLWRGELQ